MENDQIKQVKLLITIIDRGKGKKVTSLLNEKDIKYHLIALGYGTAPTFIQEYFGFGETEKDVIMSVVSEEKIKDVLDYLKEQLNIDEPNAGIAFTIPISSLSSMSDLSYLLGEKE
jgi:nitrogen regulatory protein PII-like uncharacterized protein